METFTFLLHIFYWVSNSFTWIKNKLFLRSPWPQTRIGRLQSCWLFVSSNFKSGCHKSKQTTNVTLDSKCVCDELVRSWNVCLTKNTSSLRSSKCQVVGPSRNYALFFGFILLHITFCVCVLFKSFIKLHRLINAADRGLFVALWFYVRKLDVNYLFNTFNIWRKSKQFVSRGQFWKGRAIK